MRLPKPTWRRSIAIIVVSLLIITLSFVLWANSTNPIMAEATTALQDTTTVDVTVAKYIEFKPAEPTTVGYILYPGGRVEAEAYAPTAKAIAEAGYYVAIVYAPLHLAFFDIGAGNAVIADHPEITHWVVGGHSLGGVAASLFANQNKAVQGLVFMASYPANDSLKNRTDLKIVSIYATNDGLAKPEQVLASASNLPDNATFVSIDGGNHGQFGYYGLQENDNPATITHEEQTQQVVAATVTLLAELQNN